MRLLLLVSRFLHLLNVGKSSMISLYLQCETLYLIQLKKVKKKFLIEKMKIIPLANSIFAEGKIKHWEEFLTVLTREVAHYKLEKSCTVLSISANLSHIHQLKLPFTLTRQELKIEIDKYFQRELLNINEDLLVDFVVNPNVIDNICTLYFVATRKSFIQQYVNYVRKTGLKVKVVEDDLHSLIRAISNYLPSSAAAYESFGFIHQTQNRIIFIIFNLFGILFHQEWRIKDASSFTNILKNNIELFLRDSAPNKINKLFLSCLDVPSALYQTLKNEFGIEIYQPDLLAQLLFTKPADESFLTENIAEFLIPIGAAMRERDSC